MSKISKRPFVSYHGMKKSARLLYDFAFFYFPLHNLELKDFFTYYPLLGFAEAMVYETDVLIEAGQAGESGYQAEAPVTRFKHLMVDLLQEISLYDPAIEIELEHGEEYYRLENQMMHDHVVTHELIMHAAEHRTFDMRVLHRILFKMLDKPYDESLFTLIRPVEELADIEDDIVQYHDDVKDNSYNTYRMFVRLYGQDAPQRLAAEIKKYEEQIEKNLASLPLRRKWKYLWLLNKFRKDHPEPSIPSPILE